MAEYFSLSTIFDQLNITYFEKTICAEIIWGKSRTNKYKTKKSLLLGSYNSEKKIIRIHPCLNQSLVPQICVERIIFHEMVHQKFPPRKILRKYLIHTPEFCQFEKKYTYIKEADNWLKANLDRLLCF